MMMIEKQKANLNTLWEAIRVQPDEQWAEGQAWVAQKPTKGRYLPSCCRPSPWPALLTQATHCLCFQLATSCMAFVCRSQLSSWDRVGSVAGTEFGTRYK